MAKNKTMPTEVSVSSFIESVENEQKKADSYRIIELMSEVSGFQPKMWGPSIIGFGEYHYTYKSGHSGSAPLLGFSPRKAAISLYVFTGLESHKYLLKDLGKFKMGKACIYIKKLSDIDEQALRSVMESTIGFLKKTWG
ncbi:MAG: DUF1801 domain-containing protein [Cryomorphaceae bacterium]|nr:DUF1801 domain-containing protein [Cryomorphaceae bacterium]